MTVIHSGCYTHADVNIQDHVHGGEGRAADRMSSGFFLFSLSLLKLSLLQTLVSLLFILLLQPVEGDLMNSRLQVIEMMIIWEGGVEVAAPVLVVPVTGGGPGQVQVQAVTERDPHVEEQTSGNPLKVTSLPIKLFKCWFDATQVSNTITRDIIQTWVYGPPTRQQAGQPPKHPPSPGLGVSTALNTTSSHHSHPPSPPTPGVRASRRGSVMSEGIGHLRAGLYVHRGQCS